MCKSHLMIAIYSEWRPLLFTCLLWARPFIFEKSGRGGGGLAKTEKKIMHKKRRRTSSYTTKHGKEWEDFMQVPPPLDKPILLRLPNLCESAMKRFPG